MKVKLSLVVVSVSLLLAAVTIPSIVIFADKMQNSTVLVKPSVPSTKDFNHVDILLSSESKESNRTFINEEEKNATLEKQMNYLESLDSNSLLEALVELSIYDEPNFERYGETIGAILMGKWNGVVPDGFSEIVIDKNYPVKFRGFAVDALLNTDQKLNATVFKHLQKVVQDKSDDHLLREYILISLKPSNLKHVDNHEEVENFNLYSIFKDEKESVLVKAAAITAMGRLNAPNYETVLDILAENKTNQDQYLLRTLFVSAANSGKLDPYMDLVREVIRETKDQEVFGSAIYGLATQGGEEAILLSMQNTDRFSGRANDIIRYSLLANANHILTLLDSDNPNDIILAINAAETIQYGEAYSKISDLKTTSGNADVIQSATKALESIDQTISLYSNKSEKWGR